MLSWKINKNLCLSDHRKGRGRKKREKQRQRQRETERQREKVREIQAIFGQYNLDHLV